MSMPRPKPDTRYGRLHCTVLYGAALKVCDRNSSDPFVNISVDGKEEVQTHVRESSINPVWNEKFIFEDVSASMTMTVRCSDKDKLGKPDPMGRGEVSIADQNLYEGENKECRVPMVLQGREYGYIQLLLCAKHFGNIDPPPTKPQPPPPPPAGTWSPAGSPRVTAPRANGTAAGGGLPPLHTQPPPAPADQFMTPAASAAPTGLAVDANLYKSPVAAPEANSGRLGVTVLQARDLVPLPANPLPEPYVKFRLHAAAGAGQKFKTRACAPGTTEPVWNVKFTFVNLPRNALHTQRLQIEVWDQQATTEALAAGICDLHTVADHGDQLDSWVTVFRGNPGEEEAAGEVRLVLTPEGLD